MSEAQNGTNKYVGGAIALAVVTSIATSVGGTFFLDPEVERRRIEGLLAEARAELKKENDELKRASADQAREIGALNGSVAAIESRVAERLGAEGYSAKDARQKANADKETFERIEKNIVESRELVDDVKQFALRLEDRVLYLERQK